MNFQELLSKMVELDQPVPEATIQQAATVLDEPAQEGNEFSGALAKAKEAGQDKFEVDGKQYQVKEDGTVEECPSDMSPPSPEGHDDGPKPTVSINLNAQGIDDIAELMNLMTKVNPDMINQKGPESVPSIDIIPSGAMSNDRPELPPLKMLPDFDADNDNKPGGDMDSSPMQKAMGDVDGDGDHDMDDHDAEEKPKEKEEAYANEPDEETKSVDYMNNKLAGGMNKPKQMVKHSYKQGDNPMAMPEGDLRASIRAELLQRLAEAKGAK
jgi:hypothetical protein